jgi:hypothetical protein
MQNRVEVLDDEPEEPVKAPEKAADSPVQEKEEEEKKKPEPPLVNTCEDLAGAMQAANIKKAEGNVAFANGNIEEALGLYSEAIDLSAGCDAEKERAVFFANRAAVHLAQHAADQVTFLVFAFHVFVSVFSCIFFVML